MGGPRPTEFWSRARRDASGCLIWTGAVGAAGYGHLRIAGVLIGAHRRSYELAVGPIPTGALVCHRCDVRRCVEPTHLFVGSVRDNLEDARAKGLWNPQPMTWSRRDPVTGRWLATVLRDGVLDAADARLAPAKGAKSAAKEG